MNNSGEPREPAARKSEAQPREAPSAANSALFASDEFRMYCMKVLPCSKRFVHDWPSCPFAHPDEKAKRRDPRTHDYDCEMCPAVVKGEVCELGAACPHSHHVFEAWLHPQKYRTLLCKDREACDREVCFFAHGPHELRTPERGFQPRLAQQHGAALAGSSDALSAASSRPYYSRSGVRSRSAASYLPHNQQQQQQQQRVAMAAGSVSSGFGGSSSSSNASSTMQLQGYGLAPCQNFPAAGGVPAWQLQQQQQGAMAMSATVPSPSTANMAAQLQAAVAGAGAGGSSLSQLVHQLAAEASASRHEAAEHTRAAAAAEQKLHLLEQLVGCGMLQSGPAGLQGAASPPSAGQVATPLNSWQGSPQAARTVQQLQMQQLLLDGTYDSLYPRRHSCDEALLRRLNKDLPAAGGGFVGIGCSMGQAQAPWDAAGQLSGFNNSSTLMQPQQVLHELGPSPSADIQALAAPFAAAGTAPSLQFQQAAALGNMQVQGLSNATLLAPAGTPAGALQLCAGNSNSWLGAAPTLDALSLAVPQAGNQWAGNLAPLGLFNNSSLPALPSIPSATQAQMPGSLSLSASHLQQQNYHLQLQAALQANSGMVRPPGAAAAQPGRSSFDAGAGQVMAQSLATDVLPGQEVVGVSSGGNVTGNSGGSNAQLDGGAAGAQMPDQLMMGWF